MSKPLSFFRGRPIAGLLVLWLGLSVFPSPAYADGVPPVTLQLREQESGRFLVQLRVPQQLPQRAIPSPTLPQSCRAVGERSLTERPGAWFVRHVYDCPDGLSGQSVGINFPLVNVAFSTILRIELLSGDRFAHSFAPGESAWQVPDILAGDERAFYRESRDAVLAGARHFLRNGVHWVFFFVLLLTGVPAVSRLAAAFAGAQLLGLLFHSIGGLEIPAPMAEVGVAVAVVLLAREALRPPAERRQLVALAACAGLVHGLAMANLVAPPAGHSGSGTVFLALAVLGMDAALLLAGLVSTVLRRVLPEPGSLRVRTAATYALAIAAVALAIGLPATDVRAAVGSTAATMRLPDLPIPANATGTPASQRLAARFPDSAVQSFLTVAPFEVRHEVLVRLRELAADLGLPATGTVTPEQLGGIKENFQNLLMSRHLIRIDGDEIEPVLVRADFLTLDDRGVLPRQGSEAEEIETAWIGLTVAYLTPKTPETLALTWELMEGQTILPATITDPESTQSIELTPDRPVLEWTNELSEDPTPIVEALAVEPAVAWIPTLSLVIVALTITFCVAAARRGQGALVGALPRVGLAAALVLTPVGAVAVPLPGGLGAVPDEQAAQRILSRLLPNVYRAFEFPTESAVYDRLALSVTGDTLGEIYLEHRRAVEMEERGGARARVEAVEVLGVSSVVPGDEDGFVVAAEWTVGGTVTHFGHRHYRRNRYDARATLVPIDGTWKIRSIEIFDEQRLQ